MYPNKFKPKPCKACGTTFQPTNPCHLYCSDTCKPNKKAMYLKRVYRISTENHQKMKIDQDSLCAICGSKGFLIGRNGHTEKLHIDHCHTTGKVRGLLCPNCNRALGLFQDNPELMRQAATYVEEHKEGATTIPLRE